MEERKKTAPTLSMDEAEKILDNVFRECGRKPNSVPIEALSSYAIYRKERFGLQRGFLISMMAIFFMLPFLFIDSDFTVSVEAAGERRLPVYVVEVRSFLPVYRVTAHVRGQELPVYEAGAKTFTVEPTRNGEMKVEVGLVNRQYTEMTVDVEDVDSHGPVLTSSEVKGREVHLYVEDEGVGVRLHEAYGETASGTKIEPRSTDEDKGLLIFDYPQEDMDVYIPDHIGNTLHLAMKRTARN